MIDKWFIDDINKAAAGEGRVVVTDAREEGKFLLNYLPSQFVLLPVASIAPAASSHGMTLNHSAEVTPS